MFDNLTMIWYLLYHVGIPNFLSDNKLKMLIICSIRFFFWFVIIFLLRTDQVGIEKVYGLERHFSVFSSIFVRAESTAQKRRLQRWKIHEITVIFSFVCYTYFECQIEPILFMFAFVIRAYEMDAAVSQNMSYEYC